MNVTIHMKSVAKRKNTINKITMNYSNKPATMQGLIEETVKICVTEYNERKDNEDLLIILTDENIRNQEITGKITFGRNYGEKKADTKDAIENALQCYKDGIVAIFVDGIRKEKLMDEIDIREGSEITFVRLAMLSGRMW
ncbi:hypothetical protein [Anaerosporobacter sp.]